MSLLRKFFGNKRLAVTTTQIRESGGTSMVAEAIFLRRIPFIGKKNFKQQRKILSGTSALTGFIAIVILGLSYFLAEFANERTKIATDLQMLTQRVATVATESTSGGTDTISTLSETHKSINDDINILVKGRGILPAIRGDGKKNLDGFIHTWNGMEPSIKTILENSDKLSKMSDMFNNTTEDLKSLSLMIGKVEMLMAHLGASRTENTMMASMNNSTNEMLLRLSNAKTASTLPVNIKVDLVRAMQNTKQASNYLIDRKNWDGFDPVKDHMLFDQIITISKMTSVLDHDMSVLLGSIDAISTAKNAALSISHNSGAALKQSRDMVKYFTSVDHEHARHIAIIGGVILVFALVLGSLLFVVTLAESKSQNLQIEESILSLMNDLAVIADGDLTIRTQISEDITGAIADSINFTVVKLKNTMLQVQQSANKVTYAAGEAKKQTEEARDTVIGQSKQIENAATGVLSLTDSIQSVSMTADESADVAHEALRASDEGKRAVANAIGGMDLIRNEIQETSKRIKRLGESSQEVGEIVTLISDMTEQTNVLALNASIQAAAAGEAGRGFRAVATEVQRLAERSENALKRIVALIQSIQSDTQNAVSAMERSTQKVVEGAQITNTAGEALDKIEAVSRNLAGLIESISRSTTMQNDDANVMRDRIQEVLKIAHATTEEMEETSAKIVEITTLADEMKETVSGFKL
jgi:twitching motility protein PilJ